jgi:hypothetical protein
MLAGSGDALLLGAGKQPQKVRHMKKKHSKKPEVPTDPVINIYNTVFYLLNYLRTMVPQRLNPPSVYENGFDGEIHGTKPMVDRCWKEFDNVIGLYLQTVQSFSPKLREIYDLRKGSVVSDAVFRTFADKQRNTAFLDDAIEFITKGFHLFRQLYEVGGAVSAEDRTEEVFYRQVGICSRIWEQHSYDIRDIEDLESGLKWELATIHNRRSPTQSTLLPIPESSFSNNRKGIGGRPPRDSITKRSNRELLIAILLEHHRFNHTKKDLNLSPISTEEACVKLGREKPTLSRTWPAIKNGLTYKKYRAICGRYSTLEEFLKKIDSKEGYLERTNNKDAIDYSEE